MSDWSSDVCSSDLRSSHPFPSSSSPLPVASRDSSLIMSPTPVLTPVTSRYEPRERFDPTKPAKRATTRSPEPAILRRHCHSYSRHPGSDQPRSEEQTSELQTLMRISYAVFCLTK